MGLSIGTLFPLRLRLWFGQLLFKPLGPSTYRVSWHRVIKRCDPPEVEAMQYLASHTNIPFPKIHAIHMESEGDIFIETEYVEGEPLNKQWPHMSMDQRDRVFTDIQQHISRLRELQPPHENRVSSAFGNPFHDGRLGTGFIGPAATVAEFHSIVRGHLVMEDVPILGDEVVKVHTGQYKIRFTHADLAGRNIMVMNGRVVAIIDWAYAGWYPEYWELTKAYFSPDTFDHDWLDRLDRMLPGYETELAAETILCSRLGEPATPSTSYYDGKEIKWPGMDPSETWMAERKACGETKDLWSVALLPGPYSRICKHREAWASHVWEQGEEESWWGRKPWWS